MDEIEKFKQMVRHYNKLTSDIMRNQYVYSIEQKIKKQNGRADRRQRTHQLISLGCLWDKFLHDNNLSAYSDVKHFENVLSKNLFSIFSIADL